MRCAPVLGIVAVGVLGLGMPARAQFDSGSDGSDGAFAPAGSVEIDLSLAATGPWDMASPVPGQGVYDPDLWAVVFKYTTITTPGFQVTFRNHPSGAPVVWLATGDAVINGSLLLDGANGHNATQIPFYSEPGPGGFAGARAGLGGGAGFGPGGSDDLTQFPGGGSYGTAGVGVPEAPTYGNDGVVPLIGGSGGSVVPGATRGAGAGGGAIFIASSTMIRVTSLIRASGAVQGSSPSAQGGKGSGGAIRLRAPIVSGGGALLALGGNDNFTGDGGAGRIRIEADQMLMTSQSNPLASVSAVASPLFPPADAPTLRVVSVNGASAPADPLGGILTEDVTIDSTDGVTILIEAMNVPAGTVVEVRIVPERGPPINVMSTPLAGTLAVSTASADVTFPRFRSEVQLRAVWTP